MRITADPSAPECNGPFLLCDIPDVTCVDGQSDECRGFYVLCPIDNRFVEMDDETNWYSARVSSDGKKIVLKVPGWPFALCPKGPHSSFLCGELTKQLGESMRKSMNNAHSFFDNTDEDMDKTAKAEARKWKYYELDFTSVTGVGELSSKKVYKDAGELESLDFDFLSVPASWGPNRTVLRSEDWLGFKVGVSEGGRKTSRKVTSKSKLAQKKASQMASGKSKP